MNGNDSFHIRGSGIVFLSSHRGIKLGLGWIDPIAIIWLRNRGNFAVSRERGLRIRQVRRVRKEAAPCGLRSVVDGTGVLRGGLTRCAVVDRACGGGGRRGVVGWG
jgi:hypothetical protein